MKDVVKQVLFSTQGSQETQKLVEHRKYLISFDTVRISQNKETMIIN